MNKIKQLIARYVCAPLLENDSKYYKYAWFFLPNWRYYITLRYEDLLAKGFYEQKRFGKYKSDYWEVDRLELYKLNFK